MSAALDLSDVQVRFGSVHALDGLTLTAQAGQVTAVLGPNGAGKTTLLRCCTGLITPERGSISVLGHQPGSEQVRARVGVMPQATGAWSAVKARELVAYLATLYADPQPVDPLCAHLGIDTFARTPYRRLSGGQKQAVNLAGALVGRPELVFLDEPTAGMDPHARKRTWQVIEQLRAAGVGVVLTTHSMDEAAALADQVWIIDAGRVQLSGTVAELTAHGDSLEDVFLSHTAEGRL